MTKQQLSDTTGHLPHDHKRKALQKSHLGEVGKGGDDIVQPGLGQLRAVGHVQGFQVAEGPELLQPGICDVLAEAEVEFSEGRQPRERRHVAVPHNPEFWGMEDAAPAQVQILEVGQWSQHSQIRLWRDDFGILQVQVCQLSQGRNGLHTQQQTTLRFFVQTIKALAQHMRK